MPSWTPPRTWTSAILLSSELNVDIRDNMGYLKGIADGVTFSGCQASRSTTQSIADSTDTTVSYNTEVFDYGGWYTGTGTDVVVPAGAIPAGFTTIALMIVARSRFVANGTGGRLIRLLKNGTAFGGMATGALTGDPTDTNVTYFTTAVAGDIITVQVRQTSGGALNTDVNGLTVVRYAPAV